jgi:hypothetical protein
MSSPSWFVIFQRLVHETPHAILLLSDILGRIHGNQLILLDDFVVLGQDA